MSKSGTWTEQKHLHRETYMSLLNVITAIDRNKDSLLAKKNVVSVGCGYQTEQDRLGIIVGVSEKMPEISLMSTDLVPQAVDDVPIEIQQVGVIHVNQDVTTNPRIKHRPIFPGLSVAHHQVTAGTFGCVVVKDGQEMLLSNNHVLANSNNSKIGDPIWQPGKYDGGTSADTVGVLYQYVPIVMNNHIDDGNNGGSKPSCGVAKKIASISNFVAQKLGRTHRLAAYNSVAASNKVDAALARLTVPYDKSIPGIGRPTALGEVELGMEVQKFGRTTFYTKGIVTQIYMTVNVNYGGSDVATFDNQIGMTSMSSGGDSGSAICDMHGNLVALLFAGSDSITICNPISEVFNALGVTLPL